MGARLRDAPPSTPTFFCLMPFLEFRSQVRCTTLRPRSRRGGSAALASIVQPPGGGKAAGLTGALLSTRDA